MSLAGTTLKKDNPALERMVGFVNHDPENLKLIADTSALAAQAGETEIVAQLLRQHEAIAPLPPQLRNLRAQAAMAEGRWHDAADELGHLIEEIGSEPVLNFNLAWARAMVSDHAGALDLLDDATLTASPRAPALKIHMMHHLGLFEEALAQADNLMDHFPGNHELAGAIATLAIDAENPETARQFAEQAAQHSNEAATALGTLLLNDFAVDDAAKLFDRALELSPNDPRAHVGKGLALLTEGDANAVASLDRGAELFKDHIGSWIAAGWAYFTAGDHDRARQRFETALAIDDNFAESHGALAVMDIVAGDSGSGRRRAELALRLDRQCFAAILAKSLLLDNEGRGDAGEAMRKRAMSAPIDQSGLTIAKAVAGFGMKRGSGKRS